MGVFVVFICLRHCHARCTPASGPNGHHFIRVTVSVCRASCISLAESAGCWMSPVKVSPGGSLSPFAALY